MTAGVIRFRSALRESVTSDSGADVVLAVAGAAAACVLADIVPLVARLLVWIGVVVTGVFLARAAIATYEERTDPRARKGPGRRDRTAVAGRVLAAALRISALLLGAQAVGYIG